MRGLNGKNVIVTGGAGAIGSAICRRFAEYGAKVGVFDRNLEGAKKVAGEIKGFACGADISDYKAVADGLHRRLRCARVRIAWQQRRANCRHQFGFGPAPLELRAKRAYHLSCTR